MYSLYSDIIHEGQDQGVIRWDIRGHYLTFIFMGATDTTLSSVILGNETSSPKTEKEIIEAITTLFSNEQNQNI